MAKYGLIRGHGYSDPGAVGNGTNERDFLTPVVQRIAQYLDNDIIYEISRDAFQDRTVVEWAKSNGVEQVIEFHLDSGGNDGHVIVNDRYQADDVDKRCEQVVAKHFGSKGIVGRTDLYNLNVCGDAGISYRLVEICPVTNTEDMQYFASHIDEVARDFAIAISGGGVVDASPVIPQPTTPPKNEWEQYAPKNYNYGFDSPKIAGMSAWHDAYVEDGMAFYPYNGLYFNNANRFDGNDAGTPCKYFTFESGKFVIDWQGQRAMSDGHDVVVTHVDGVIQGYWSRY